MKSNSSYDLPFKERRLFLMDQEVLVIKEFLQFGLCKVKYVDQNECFVISKGALSISPVNEVSININKLGGLMHDS